MQKLKLNITYNRRAFKVFIIITITPTSISILIIAVIIIIKINNEKINLIVNWSIILKSQVIIDLNKTKTLIIIN